jgi:hypothetical protein
MTCRGRYESLRNIKDANRAPGHATPRAQHLLICMRYYGGRTSNIGIAGDQFLGWHIAGVTTLPIRVTPQKRKRPGAGGERAETGGSVATFGVGSRVICERAQGRFTVPPIQGRI